MRYRHAIRQCLDLWVCTLAFTFVSASVQAAGQDSVSFRYKDWALQCDNTRTCRAVGYQAESGESEPVSILLTRAAGPGTPVQVDLQVSTEQASPSLLHLKAGRLSLPNLDGHSPRVPVAQVPKLLLELLKNEEATVTAGNNRWVLSLAGASAVLLKMDEAQGRLGTPGALVRKGAKAESSVLPSMPAPLVRGVKPLPVRPGDSALAKVLLSHIDTAAIAEQCNGEPLKAGNVRVHRLTASKVLLEVPCGMGAYNFSSLLWMANDSPPHNPQALEDVQGEFNPGDGSVHEALKGRGIGDCWSVREWQFDGKGFALKQERSDSMCRGFAGGAWQLPSYVTR